MGYIWGLDYIAVHNGRIGEMVGCMRNHVTTTEKLYEEVHQFFAL